MTKLDCMRAMRLVDRARGGLDEAERLRLEEHLQGCTACAERARLLASIGEVLRSAAPLDAAARERALGRAFRARASSRPAARAPVWRLRPFAVVAAAALATVLLLLAVRPPAPSVLSSPLDAPLAERARPAAAAAASEVTSLEEGASKVLPGARVTALRRATLRFDEATSTVHLDAGAMRFEVEPGRAAPFRVVAPDLEVEVLGTVFEVDGPEVRVERGRVRVTSARHDRSVELGAGERVRWDERAALDGPAAAASVASGAASASVDAAPLLARARRHLAAREVEPARRLLGQVLSGSLTPSVEAEAQTLLAECALVAGDHDEAARRYAEVAKRHGDLPAGETALFAAAREAHASGRRPAARQLFEQYLARYPRGQFVAEARSRLSQLSP